MLNLLNAVDLFGQRLGWNASASLGVLITLAVVLLIVAAALMIYLAKLLKKQPVATNETQSVVTVAQPVALTVEQPVEHSREIIYVKEEQPEVERALTGITLDLGVVQREFNIEDEFTCAGLVVHAEYNVKPTSESLVDYTLVDSDTYARLEKKDKLNGVYVIKPQLRSLGVKVVVVRFRDQMASYTVTVIERKNQASEPVVIEKVIEKPIVVEKVVEVEKPVVVERVVERPVDRIVIDEESVEAGRLRYDRSFEARLIQSDDEIKHWYTEIKNELLSYTGCKARISWKRETFKANKQVVAMLGYRGKTLCLFLRLDPSEYGEEYNVEDASTTPIYEDTPALLRIKSDKRAKLALELIKNAMKQIGVLRKVGYVSQDFYVPYEGILELINKGLIKREIRDSEEEAIFDRDKQDA